MSALRAEDFPDALGISIVPSEDGEGYDIDAVSRIHDKEGRAQDWVWSGWDSRPDRGAYAAATEWEFRKLNGPRH